MAYDEQLADRVRDLLAAEPEVTERKMFGGLAFLLSGNMAVTVSGQGGLMVRVDPDRSDAMVEREGVCYVEMRGRTLNGWIRVDDSKLAGKRALRTWVELGMDYARALPAKGAAGTPRRWPRPRRSAQPPGRRSGFG